MTKGNDRFDAIRFQQGIGAEEGQTMYLCAMPARWLVSRPEVDRWRADVSDDDVNKQGYQRALSDSHLRAIVRYLLGTFQNAISSKALPVFPTSVLLSAREDIDFAPTDPKASEGPKWAVLGKLTLPSTTRLYIIDGQHRIEGIKRAMEEAPPETKALLGDYHLPVTIMQCPEKTQEMYHFVTINKEAKNVRTDLAEQLLDVLRASDSSLIRDPKIRDAAGRRAAPLAIARELCVRDGQPWLGRIAKPNERRKGERVAGQGQLAKSLRHICQNPPVTWTLDRLIQYVIDFWITLRELLPEAFTDPQSSTIQRAVGFGALHRLLQSLVLSYNGTRESIAKVLKGVEPYFTDASYWSKGGESSQYSSEGGYSIHAQRMLDAINEQTALRDE